jgi:hypothetical protein
VKRGEHHALLGLAHQGARVVRLNEAGNARRTVEETAMTERPTLRTANGVLTPDADPYWGTTLREVSNPDAVEGLPEGLTKAIRLPPNFKRAPAKYWGAMLDLFDYVLAWDEDGKPQPHGSTCESTTAVLRGNGTVKPYAEWRFLAPTQENSGAYSAIDYGEPLVDIVTGERFASLAAALAQGYIHAGDVHSHGRLAAFHSGTDDQSDLAQPGIHLVVGNIHKDGTCEDYDVALSVTRRGKRYSHTYGEDGKIRPFVLSDLVEGDGQPGSFHEEVLTVVKQGKRTIRTGWTPSVSTAREGYIPWKDRKPLSALVVWVASRITKGAVIDLPYTKIDSGERYHLSREDAAEGRRGFTKGEDVNALHLEGYSAWKDAEDAKEDSGSWSHDTEAAIDALEAAHPDLSDILGTLDEWLFPDGVAAVLKAVTDASTMQALHNARAAGAIDAL